MNTSPPARRGGIGTSGGAGGGIGGAMTSVSREIELKLLAAQGDLPRIVGIVSTCGQILGEPARRRVLTRYFDTPELGLARQGVALRLRQDGERWLLALKTAGAEPGAEPAAVAVRREWECPLSGPELDLAALDAAGAGGWIPRDLRTALLPLFETEVERTELLVSPADGALIDIAVDVGRVVGGGGELPLSEVELERREGPLHHLFDLALALHEKLPLRIGTENKADLGLRLIGAQGAVAVAPPAAGLSRVMTAAEAFRHLARAATGHLLANLACAVNDSDPGGIRQIREAVRRLRAVLRLFADLLPSDQTAHFEAESRWLSQRLAEVPQWDALATLLLASDEAAMAADSRQLRREAGLAAIRGLRTRRFTQFVLELARWLESDQWRLPAPVKIQAQQDRPVADLAPVWLARLTQRAEKAGVIVTATGRSGIAALEGWRRRLRRLRLAAELTRGVFPAGAAQPLLDTTAGLLDCLERVHELARARRSLARLAVEYPVHGGAVKRLDAAWAAQILGLTGNAVRTAPTPLPVVATGR